jgi:hypothetical protein
MMDTTNSNIVIHILKDFQTLICENPTGVPMSDEDTRELKDQILRLNEMYSCVRLKLLEELEAWLNKKVN